jgi:NADPH:quinone reductase-like Zn-dependent oxidoreductase
LGSERPAILGWDISGEVVEKAGDVTDFQIGEAIFGLTKGKGYAEYVAVKTDIMAHKPENISYEEAATVPVVGIFVRAVAFSYRVKKANKGNNYVTKTIFPCV